MKKIKLLAVFGIVCFCLGTFFSCNANVKTPGGAVSKVEYEMEKLASVAELDAFVTRGKENLIAETKAKMSLDDIFSKMQEGALHQCKVENVNHSILAEDSCFPGLQ